MMLQVPSTIAGAVLPVQVVAGMPPEPPPPSPPPPCRHRRRRRRRRCRAAVAARAVAAGAVAAGAVAARGGRLICAADRGGCDEDDSRGEGTCEASMVNPWMLASTIGVRISSSAPDVRLDVKCKRGAEVRRHEGAREQLAALFADEGARVDDHLSSTSPKMASASLATWALSSVAARTARLTSREKPACSPSMSTVARKAASGPDGSAAARAASLRSSGCAPDRR